MLSRLMIFAFCIFTTYSGHAQTGGQCPQNIGFEAGTFDNWKCYTGSISSTMGANAGITPTISLAETSPNYNSHLLIKKGNTKDPYGDFSLNSPNGSEYIVRLGNDTGGRGAEQISYTLTVPANVDAYYVIFNYAVVLQNFNHTSEQQPKFAVRVINEASGLKSSCGSYDFVASGALPGFETSLVESNVLYKTWSPVLLNLSEHRGNKVRIEFTTNDCTFSEHFGYVYLDFTENCSYPVTGNVVCPSPEPITLKTLPGFSKYTWYNAVTNEQLGNDENFLMLPPNTPAGTKLAVELVPFPGLGCPQTLYTTIESPVVNVNQPPPDCVSVDISATSVIAGNYPELTYSYWMNEAGTIPVPDPKKITKSGIYYIKGTKSPGCFAMGEVEVRILESPTISITDPEPATYPATVDITQSYISDRALKYTYWRDENAKNVLSNPAKVNRDGTYYIKATNAGGCSIIAAVTADIIYTNIVIPNTFTPNGDGVNDLLTVFIDDKVKVKSFKIFNQWGQAVFVTSDIYNYWDGFRGGSTVPSGVYYWLCEGLDDLQKKFLRSGSVTLIR